MEIACVLDSRLGSPARPGLSGGLRPGRHALADPVEAAERTEALVRRPGGDGAAGGARARGGGRGPGRQALADPVEAAERTEALVRRLEAIGAAVESERVGEAFFAVDGLRGIHGGDSAGVLATGRGGLEGPPPRGGTGPGAPG